METYSMSCGKRSRGTRWKSSELGISMPAGVWIKPFVGFVKQLSRKHNVSLQNHYQAEAQRDKGSPPVHEMCSWLIFQELKYHPECPPPGRTFVLVYPYFSALLPVQTFRVQVCTLSKVIGSLISYRWDLRTRMCPRSKPPFFDWQRPNSRQKQQQQ